MRALPFTLRQLQVFATLCEVLSFRECAEKLGISQASVSNQISLLEDQLGFKLFARSPGKRPSLTPRGLAFRADMQSFDQAGQTLAAHRMAADLEASPSQYRVLMGEALFNGLVRPRLPEFVARNPLIECHFDTFLPGDAALREIGKSNTDFAMFHLRDDWPVELNCKPLASVRGGIFGNRKFAPSSGGTLGPREISEMPFILPRAGSEQEKSQLESMSSRGIVPRNIICHTEYFDVIVALVEQGMGVASLSEQLISPKSRDNIMLLFPLTNWKLLWYRKPTIASSHAGLIEHFLIDCIVRNPDYPTIEVYV